MTNAYAAKKALFDLLDANNGPSQVLDGVQVAYAYPARDVEEKCVYGGGVRFDHEDDVAESPGVLVRETALVGVYVRVVTRPALSVAETDTAAAAIGAAVLGLVKANPKLAGALTWVGVRSGQGDYSQTDDETIAVLAYQFRFISRFAY